MHNLTNLEKKLKIQLKQKNILKRALTHKSFSQINNNEKLEFLGDRVIGLILSKKLCELYENEKEGVLDKRFAQLVNKKTCASIGWSMGLKDFIILGDTHKVVKKSDEKILSDACEAIVGAIYTDRGFNYVKEFVLRIWEIYIRKSNITVLDSKTKLQEYSLKIYKALPVYKMLSFKGPKHSPVFKISVCIKNSKKFIGSGASKKEAEQSAATILLNNISIK